MTAGTTGTSHIPGGHAAPRKGPTSAVPFSKLSKSVQRMFNSVTSEEDRTPALFKTYTGEGELYDVYLSGLAPSARQHHQCKCCRDFVNRFGSLVVVAENGDTHSALWDHKDVPVYYRSAVKALQDLVEKAPIESVYKNKDVVWGTPKTGSWTHFYLKPSAEVRRVPSMIQEAHEYSAEKTVLFGTLERALVKYPLPITAKAVQLLSGGGLDSADATLGIARWLHVIQDRRTSARSAARKRNITWHAVAICPAGFANAANGMLGTLMDDIVAKTPLPDLVRKWNAKMDPLKKSRSQAAPTQGNIDRAETIIAKLGLAESLKRRYAWFGDLETIWTPRPVRTATRTGVFKHLRVTEGDPMPSSRGITTTMTWVKFRDTVLRDATSMWVLAEDGLPMMGLLTADNPNSPPILSWDRDDRRNPVSWYFRDGHNYASSWGLVSRSWVRVTGVCLKPSLWYGAPKNNLGEGATLILEGCHDVQGPRGVGLFASCMRSELHEIRATMEAHSNATQVMGLSRDQAAGVCVVDTMGSMSKMPTIAVRTSLGWQDYKIDRWD